MYNFEEDKLIEEIKERKAKRILLQLPEGLKKETVRIVRIIEDKTNADVIVSGDTLWGACDVKVEEAKKLKCDLIIVYGHNQFMKIDFPVIYMGVRYEKNIDNDVSKVLPYLKKYKKIGLAASIQHSHQLENVKEFLEKNNKKVEIAGRKGHANEKGQILGCEYNALKLIDVDGFLILGNRFHALGASLAVTKDVILLDVINEEIDEMNKFRNKIIKQRAVAISNAKNARKFGIIIGLKEGQTFGSANFLKQKFVKNEKEAVLISMDEVDDSKLINLYDIDCFVNLACPRISIDNVARFSKTMINYREALVVLDELKWEELLKQGIL